MGRRDASMTAGRPFGAQPPAVESTLEVDSAREAVNATTVLRVLAVLSLALPLAFFCVSAVLAWNAHKAEAQERLVRSLDLVHEHTLRVFDTFDLVAEQVNEHVRDLTDDEIRAAEARLNGRLSRLNAALPQVQDIWVIDSAGHPLVTANVFPVPRELDLSDRDYFRSQVPADAPVYVSEVLRGRAMPNVTFFQIASRRPSVDGSFTGVTAVSVQPEYFRAFYARVAERGVSSMTLFRADGAILARFPEGAKLLEPLRPDNRFFSAVANAPERGVYRAFSHFDGVDRLSAYQRVRRGPVYASVGIDHSGIVAAWRSQLLAEAAFLGPAALALFGLSLVALRRTRRESEALARVKAESTRRHAAEAALRQSQKMETLGQLTGGVAHVFNNLLMAVISNLDLLKKRWEPDAKALRLIDGALQGAERGAILTQRLLAFSRRQDLRPEPVDVVALVQGMADLIECSVGPLVSVRIDPPRQIRSALVDPNQLELALLNLAVNARDAMPTGGSLLIALRQERLEAGERDDLRAGDYLRLSVADTGAGMEPETLARAVEPFFSTKGPGKGTGLGLSMVHGLAAQSGGALTLTSRPGEGTTAELWLPLAEELMEVEEKPMTKPEATAMQAATILVVDDEALIQMATSDMLQDLGHETLEASSGGEALEILRSGVRVDLVITDQAMPGMTGIEFARAARELHPKLPILLATGYADLPEGTDIALPRLGKPYRQEELASRVGALLSGGENANNVVNFAARRG